jgi:hypothetical protein
VSKHPFPVSVRVNLGVKNTPCVIKSHFVKTIKQEDRHHFLGFQIFYQNVKRFSVLLSVKNQGAKIVTFVNLKIVEGLMAVVLYE